VTLVSDLGEFGLIRRWTEMLGTSAGRGVVVGIGDDAAVLEAGGGKLLLVTTDMLVEDVHFRRSYTPMDALGWKAMAASVSDIAAMGGVPTFAFVSVGLPVDAQLDAADDLYKGLAEMAGEAGVSIVGGDTVSSGKLVINVTLMGEVEPQFLALRSGARPGDALVVTGTLGDAGAGLELLQRGLAAGSAHRCLDAHLRPRPRLAEARAAVATGGVHAMIDISDGLSGDLRHVCSMSGVGAVVDEGAIPISGEARRVAGDTGLDVLNLALHAGEDYELLMATAADAAEEVCAAVRRCGRVGAAVIGRIVEGTELVLHRTDGTEVPLHHGAWQHFAEA